MAEPTSPLYDAQNTEIDPSYTYPWSNPSVSPEYYQHYVEGGAGSIDPTIFSLIRPDSIYSIGKYLTYPVGNGQYEVFENRFAKNVTNLTQFGSFYSQKDSRLFLPTFTGSCKYSPGLVNYYATAGSQVFVRNIRYNDLVFYIMPRVAYKNGTGNQQPTVRTMTIEEYQQTLQQYEYVRIFGFQYTAYYDRASSGTRVNLGVHPDFIQGAYGIPMISKQSTVYNWMFDIQKTGQDNSGVFLLPGTYPNLISTVLVTIMYKSDGNYYYPGDDDISLFNKSLFDATPITVEDSSTIVQYYGLSDVQILDKIVAALGYNYTYNQNSALYSATGANCDDPNIKCPIIDPDTNQITETVLSGADIAQYAAQYPESNFNWAGYDLVGTGKDLNEVRLITDATNSTQHETDDINLNYPTVSTGGGTQQIYLMNSVLLQGLFEWLWDPEGTIFDDIVRGLALFGNDPMNSFLSLKLFPIPNLESLRTWSGYHSICVGRTSSPISARYLENSNIFVVGLGSFILPTKYNDFRDYEPITQYSLYIPFCGIIPLSAVHCVGKTIRLEMIIDIFTGACTCVVYTDGVPYKYIDGMVGIDMPLSAPNVAQFASTVLGAALGGAAGLASGLMSGTGISNRATDFAGSSASSIPKGSGSSAMSTLASNSGVGTPNPALGQATLGVAGAVAGTALGASYEIAKVAAPAVLSALTNAPIIEKSGISTPACCIAEPLKPYFLVQEQENEIPEHFAHLYGRATCKSGIIGDFHGYSEFSQVDVSGISIATSEEKALITELLAKGVYL